ncbi:MAG TPA: hypothetical protein VK540_10665 [Polyangiaceae bacterium]|nr:hypothetical protein [Polyangiaceae bacterium]
MRASSTTLLLALAMAGCAVYDETPNASGSTAGGSGSGGGSGGPSGGSSGTGASGAKDGSSDATGNAGASGTAGQGGTSGAGGSSDVDGAAGAGGSSGTGGTSGVGGSGGAAGTSGAAGASGAGGAAGGSGSGGADGSTGTDSSSGIDRSDAGLCVVGTGPPTLPFAVDQYFLASGWMQPALIHQDAICIYPPNSDAGSTIDGGRDASDAASDRDGSSTADGGVIPPLPGSKCWTITYAPMVATDWAGVDWQYPINNWGPGPGLVIPPGAAHVSLVAWGDTGSERVTFNVGYGSASPDGFAVSLSDQVLTTSPTRYAIEVSGIAYTCNSVRMGFGWTAAGGTTMTFHIADIRWE